MKKVLVTGADGFIGSHLTEKLIKEGYDVTAFIYYNSFGSKGWLDQTDNEIKKQINFLNKGESAMLPLRLKDIAQKIGMHESTVSRCTNKKYIQTPRGVYEMKYFFSSEIKMLSNLTLRLKLGFSFKFFFNFENANFVGSMEIIVDKLNNLAKGKVTEPTFEPISTKICLPL